MCCVQTLWPKLVVVPTNARHNLFLDKLLILPVGARCCPGHLSDNVFNTKATEQISESRCTSMFNHSDLMSLITEIRDIAIKGNEKRIDFDNDKSLSDSDILTLTGISRRNLDDLCLEVQGQLRESSTRSVRTCLGIFLTKLRTGMPNKMLSTLFNLGRDSVRRAIASARKYLLQHFVPSHLGFQHISREEVISSHTRPLAQSLFGQGMHPAILVADGTYIYIQKSQQFKFQRKCYSLHKHRPLVKPMVFVSTSGYILSVIGPYYSDGKNNDAQILKHIIQNDIEEFKQWVCENDVIIVDRGFRDSVELLHEIGVRTEMPSFVKKGESQLPVEESNTTRLITKIRWIVESVNGRIKQWKYLDRVLPNSQIPYVADYVKIVCALMNKYWPETNTEDAEKEEQLGCKMLHLSKQQNVLHERIKSDGLEKRSCRWEKTSASSVLEFPRLSEEDIRNLTVGVYQLKLAPSYTREHLDSDGSFDVLICNHEPDLLCAKIQSRHVSSRGYRVWIQYSEVQVIGWYCQCKVGTRVVGKCSHVTSIIWYLGLGRFNERSFESLRDWSKYLLDAQDIPEPLAIDESENEDVREEE